jgi:hypothetical protein
MPILGIIASSRPVITGAFESIATANGTGSTGTITFSSIPATYAHLQLRMSSRNIFTGTIARAMLLRLNGSTTDNYTIHELYGDGSNPDAIGFATGGGSTSVRVGFATADGNSAAGLHGVSIVDILDYTSTSKYKTIRMFSGTDLNGSGRVYLGSSVFVLNTNAITSITLEDPATGFGFTTSSTFALYGIKGAA